jgi:hypothetical protein
MKFERKSTALFNSPQILEIGKILGMELRLFPLDGRVVRFTNASKDFSFVSHFRARFCLAVQDFLYLWSGQLRACLPAYSSLETEVGSFISHAIFTIHLIRLFVKDVTSNFSWCIQRPGNSSVIYGHFDFLPGGAARTGHSIFYLVCFVRAYL